MVFACGAAVTALSIAVATVSYRSLTTEVQPRPAALTSGREWQVVVVGAASCAASNHPEVQAAIRRIIATVRMHAQMAGENVSTAGVAVDWNHATGLEFLNRIGHFDEISIGRNWMNQVAIRYIWRDLRGPGLIPQVLLISRSLEVMNSGFLVGTDSVVKRLAGGEEIRAFDAWLAGSAAAKRLATSVPPGLKASPTDSLGDP